MEGGRVYVHYGHQGTACLDLAGKILWKNESYGYEPVHGNGGSPVLVDGLLVFSCDGADDPYVVALDAATGQERWRFARSSDSGNKFSFSTPAVITVNGQKQLITPGSGVVNSLDPATGREIWRVTDGDGYSVIPKPVYGHGLVFLATKFYNEYNGSARSNLVAIGVHEIAHQWWFGLVGNDQALEPWLDEALAVYSEAIFYRYIYPNSYDWWWNFRVNYFGPACYVDSSIYDSGTFRGYVNAVYLNGANFLEALNYRMGEEAFFHFLQVYASRYGRGHATTADFFAVARQNTTADISDLIDAYFQGDY